MIISRLTGGLGNQLFQYAAGRALALQRGDNLLFDTRLLETTARKKLVTPRAYALHHYCVAARLATEPELNEFFFRASQRGWKGTWKRFVRPAGIVQHSRTSVQFPARGDIYLKGHWQSESYFLSIRDTLLSELALCSPAGTDSQRYIDAAGGQTSVAVHYRRGDYLSNPEYRSFHGICPPGYYTKGMQYLREQVDDPVFFIFSDDLNSVRNEFGERTDLVYVDCNDGDNGHADIAIMASCKHHIIANSSFSWWGAWLCDYADQIVIAPQSWFNDANANVRADSIVPDRWIRM